MLFKVGDRVVGVGFVSGLDITGQSGTILKILETHIQYPYVIYFDKRFSHRLWGDDDFMNNSKKLWMVRECNIEMEDNEKILERRERKEELRLKYIDIDPYGEEDWTE